MPPYPVSRGSPVPLFYQVAEDLKRRIEQGQFHAGQRFITVREVAKEYGVSFVTAQRSMSRLAEEKWLISQRGRGTVVTPKAAARRPAGTTGARRAGTRRTVVLWPTHVALGSALQSQLVATLEGIRSSMPGYSLAIELGPTTFVEEETKSYLDGLLSDRAGAGFFLVSAPPHIKQYFAHHRVPTVVLGDVEPGIELSAVSSREERAIFDLTLHLLALGHRRIAHLLNAPRVAGHESRLAGYRRALIDAGHAPRAEDEVIVPYDRDLATICFRELLYRPDPPTAAICTGLTLASWFKAMAGERLHVAYDVDRAQESSGLVPSTLLVWPGAAAGRLGAELLRAQLEGDFRIQTRYVDYVHLHDVIEPASTREGEAESSEASVKREIE